MEYRQSTTEGMLGNRKFGEGRKLECSNEGRWGVGTGRGGSRFTVKTNSPNLNLN